MTDDFTKNVKAAPESLMTPEQLADYLGVPVSTLYQWRYTNTGPAALKVGRHLRYRRGVVESWLEQQAAAS